MEAELEKLRRKIAWARYALELVAMRQIEASGQVGNATLGSTEFEQGQLLETSLRVQEASLKAELVSAHLRMAQLIVEAEIRRFQSFYVSPTVKQLAEMRERCEKVLKEHREVAQQMTDQALDADLACDRINGDKPKPQVELTAQQKREQEQEYRIGYSQ